MIRRLLDGPLKGFPDLPPVWLAGFMALAFVIDRGMPLVAMFGPAYAALGGLLMLCALALVGWSAVWFWRKKTTIEPHHTPSALIVEGPYRISRNPIYLGLLLFLVGYVLRLGSLAPVILPFAFFKVLQTRFIGPEEAALRRLFGVEAQEYLARTRRWL
ncbi:isoprenylcysteine carboxylmethyltransferase family protein [Roseibacterium sp. SDUM158017]|uniref:methyltransferase family protein n=1 Tax=Roseicyclus salinarum TaxID=3036773 RepID=UPI002415575B|nr:isoprenylcysteine carboxylmethyltransferase family protein [Roseibacterium sp. SDUM158017]MDG4648039.1 isoprenylcysteine carboxylmethyltransferase family protein [Roseibacterium sp. SDUM158017]